MRALVGLLIFQGVSAVGGGAAMVVDPSGATMGWDTGMLVATPFSSYLWPGIILGVGLGVSALVLAWGVLRRPAWPALAWTERASGHHWSWAGSVGLGIGLMAWIVVQIILIDERTFLQPVMFLIGAGLVGVSLLPSVRAHLDKGHG